MWNLKTQYHFSLDFRKVDLQGASGYFTEPNTTRTISCKVWNSSVDILVENLLQWRNNGRDCVSNHQPHDRLRNRLFRRRSKKTSKLRVTGLFPAQMASNAENVSIWWRHQAKQDTKESQGNMSNPIFKDKVQGWTSKELRTLIARFMGPTWGSSVADRTQVGPMLD